MGLSLLCTVGDRTKESITGGRAAGQQGVRYRDQAGDPVQAAAGPGHPQADGGGHATQAQGQVVEAEARRRRMRRQGQVH